MNRYQKEWLYWLLATLLIGVIVAAWGVIRAVLIDWNPLSLTKESVQVYLSFICAIFLFVVHRKDLIILIKERTVKGIDERISKILNNSLRNAATFMFLAVFTTTMYFELYYPLDVPVITLKYVANIMGASALIFMGSAYYYHKSKKL